MTNRIQGIPIMGVCPQCQQLYDECRCSERDRRRRKWQDEAEERKELKKAKGITIGNRNE
jgi:hypothetical protein